ncbi:hypothetical protein [Acinetobacter bouvetii]|uniref:SCPU domain-containing protein n=1 Tax=Acinetobacter bouvetii TaxID=202951 RepID=A0A811GFJ7_9GAMM|nr:hypothetical protein [Acinetobacter bouvetii]CAB1208528.1 hypothetical protein SFB21_0462 [Acinetobacter bouvetii]
MNKMTQAALAAFVLGACATGVYAGENDKRTPERAPVGCGVDCKDKIDIVLNVEPHCDIDVTTPTLTLQDKAGGDTKTGSFKVGANALFKINLTTANGEKLKFANNEIPVSIVTKRGGTVIPLNATTGGQPFTLGGWTKYDVTAKVGEVGINKPVGTYKEELRIAVSF